MGTARPEPSELDHHTDFQPHIIIHTKRFHWFLFLEQWKDSSSYVDGSKISYNKLFIFLDPKLGDDLADSVKK